MYYKMVIEETGRNSPKGVSSMFNRIVENFNTPEETRDWLIEHYGRLPHGRKKVFWDGKDGAPEVVGFLHSFWNKDWSHNSKPWFQTDWIYVTRVTEEVVTINGGAYGNKC